MDSETYKKYIKDNAPKTPNSRTLLKAFFVGGLICCTGEFIGDIIGFWFPDMEAIELRSWVSVTLIFITAFLTGMGVYDKIGAFGGAGSIVPITGFANSIVSPALEHNSEGIIFGLCAKMFEIAGPVIVLGITSSFIVGLIYMIICAVGG